MKDLDCGECRYFRPTDDRDEDRVGRCRLSKVMGVFRESRRACPSFSRRGDPNPPVVVDGGRGGGRRRSSVGSPAPIRRPELSPTVLAEALSALEPEALKRAVRAALHDAVSLREIDLGRAWDGGELHLVPADASLKPKQLTLDQFFHKLVMIRDNLRVLEQKVNTHSHLHDSEKVDLERRITLTHAAVARMGTGWLPAQDTDGPEARIQILFGKLVEEAAWDAMALPPPPLTERYQGGRTRYVHEVDPVDEPVERFFGRLMNQRDRLMQLEAQVAAHPHIAPDEGDGMGSYIRRCYGTLTTFNVLFRERSDYFSSSR